MNSEAHDVNEDGSVIVGESGTYDPAEGFKRHAVRWMHGEIKDLGVLP